MPSRTAYDAVAGTALTATNLDKYPGGWIGYAITTSSQGSITTSVDLTGLSIAVTVGTSRLIRISGFVDMQSTVAGDLGHVTIQEGGTQLARCQGRMETSGTAQTPVVIVLASSGAHTYKLAAARTVGTGTLSTAASATNPLFIVVEDLGPSS